MAALTKAEAQQDQGGQQTSNRTSFYTLLKISSSSMLEQV
jgi:hypothetical protein